MNGNFHFFTVNLRYKMFFYHYINLLNKILKCHYFSKWFVADFFVLLVVAYLSQLKPVYSIVWIHVYGFIPGFVCVD